MGTPGLSPTPAPSGGSVLIKLPGALACVAILTAFLNMIPLVTIYEYHKTETFCKHALNNFRDLFMTLKDAAATPASLRYKWRSHDPFGSARTVSRL